MSFGGPLITTYLPPNIFKKKKIEHSLRLLHCIQKTTNKKRNMQAHQNDHMHQLATTSPQR